MELKEYLVKELDKTKDSLIESIVYRTKEDYAVYRETIGEIRGIQRSIRLIQDLPDE